MLSGLNWNFLNFRLFSTVPSPSLFLCSLLLGLDVIYLLGAIAPVSSISMTIMTGSFWRVLFVAATMYGAKNVNSPLNQVPNILAMGQLS